MTNIQVRKQEMINTTDKKYRLWEDTEDNFHKAAYNCDTSGGPQHST